MFERIAPLIVLLSITLVAKPAHLLPEKAKSRMSANPTKRSAIPRSQKLEEQEPKQKQDQENHAETRTITPAEQYIQQQANLEVPLRVAASAAGGLALWVVSSFAMVVASAVFIGSSLLAIQMAGVAGGDQLALFAIAGGASVGILGLIPIAMVTGPLGAVLLQTLFDGNFSLQQHGVSFAAGVCTTVLGGTAAVVGISVLGKFDLPTPPEAIFLGGLSGATITGVATTIAVDHWLRQYEEE